MPAILECVPNISEGRDLEKVEKIVDAIRTTKGVKLLDYSSDKDHNRSVITFLGEPNAVAEAALKLAKAATELIDMSTHTGGHPRMGAVDVMPLIPIKDITIEETIELSKKLAESIANECNMHVTLYENSASAPHRQNLADIRRGQYEVMAEKIKETKIKFGVVIKDCKCAGTQSTDYQDKVYGKSKRVHNLCKAGTQSTCTCCGLTK